MKANFFLTFVTTIMLLPTALQAQRMQPKLGRGVVAVTRTGGSNVTVSWRKLTNDPDSCTYNIYRRAVGSHEYTKINTQPLRKTNVVLTSAQLPYNQEVAVTIVAKDGKESEKSVPYHYKKQAWNNVFVDIDFDNTVLTGLYHTSRILPLDTNGDGETDAYLVDRLGSGYFDDAEDEKQDETSLLLDHYLQAYNASDGKLLWTVQMGPNVDINSGQHDQVTAYDIDCDGRTEIIIRSSDGTRFWDSTNNTWGKYVFGNTTPDIDGDGIIDYTVSSVTRNQPHYVSIIDSSTGEEKTSCELNYNSVTDSVDQYSRNNRKDYMNWRLYYAMDGQYAIAFDGVHPMVMAKCLDRTNDGTHHDYIFAFSYDWVNGRPQNFHHSYTWSRNDKSPWPAEFHMVRVCDVDGDGIDELVPGGFAVNTKFGMVNSADIAHGDRFNLTDLDPERPGLEQYCIQQYATLGQVVYDAATGEHLKEWYLPSAFDVGRGVSMDVDSTHLGCENYSFVSDYIYDAKGKKTENKHPWPDQGIWWDGNLLRESVHQVGGKGWDTNMYIGESLSDKRLIQMSKESGWATHGITGTRPGFWGDMIGDWREEIFMMKQNTNSSTGFVGYATDFETPYTITSLTENAHYSLDCTTHGYYQSPDPDFYLGHGMLQEPVYPCVRTDLRYRDGWQFTTFDQTSTASYTDGKSLIFDISGNNKTSISPGTSIAPRAVYFMNPKGHDYNFQGTLTGSMPLTKGMQGTVVLTGNHTYTGKTTISEGTLRIDGSIASPIHLMARGTLGGNATINAPVWFEGALNYEGCRLQAGTTEAIGSMTFNCGLNLQGKRVYVESRIRPSTNETDRYIINGNLNITGGQLFFTINYDEETIPPGIYTLMECNGNIKGSVADIRIRNMAGIPYQTTINDGKIQLIIDRSRQPATDVTWTGNESSQWDYQHENFSVAGEDSRFVTGDHLIFDDKAKQFDITLNEMVKVGSTTFYNDTHDYTLRGEGGISGTGDLVKNGKGGLRILLENSDYTGRTIINDGRLTISTLHDSGKASSLGAATNKAGNILINGATLAIDGDNESSDRIITVTDTATIDVVSSSFSLKNIITGTGYLVKDGDGQLNFNHAGGYDFNGVILKKGILAQGNWQATFGKAMSPFVLAGGTLRLIENNAMSTIPSLKHAFTAQEETESTIDCSFRSNMQGSMSGKGTVVFRSGGARCYVSTDFSKFEGVLKTTGDQFLGTTELTDMSKTVLMPQATNEFAPAASDVKVGAVMSTAKDCKLGGNTVSVGYLNSDATFAGQLTAKTINKYGTGTWELTGTNGTSSLNIYEGTVRILNFTGSMTNSSLNIRAGGRVTGRGTTQSILLYKGGMLAAGVDDTTTGTIKTAGNFVGYGGGTIVVKATASDNDHYTVGGTLRLNGDTLRIVPIDGRTFKEGEQLQIFTVNGTFNSASKWVIDGGGYIWNDSQLISSGKLTCAGTSTGIHNITNVTDYVTVYSLDGRIIRTHAPANKATEGLSPGIYIIREHQVIIK